jgi:glycosyltransferase involved in cell wall biosynthesis
MRESNQPLVSIGMPVYNGESFIKEALDSIISQTYQNLEIIISDNASTDSTREICESYQEKDKRIKYVRFDENRGASINFNTTFDMSHGKYFKWAAMDDFLGNTYIAKVVSYLEENPDTHLCHSWKNIVNKDSETIKRFKYQEFDFEYEKRYDRFMAFLKTFRYIQADADVMLGVFRRSELAKTQKIANYHSADLTLTAEMVLLGKLHIIPEYVFYRRFHKGISTESHHSKAERAKWFDTKNKNRSLYQYIPMLLWFSEFLKFISKSNLKFFERIKLKMATYRWLFSRIYSRVALRLKIKNPSEFGHIFIEVK